MRVERYSIRSYWGARVESPRALAEQFATTMRQLGECDELLEQWNEQAMSYREALRLVVEPTPEAIEPLLTSIDSTQPLLFGYELTLWNGRAASEQRCELRVVGGKIPRTALGDCNRLLLSPPADLDQAIYTPAVIERILAVIVRIWRPDTAEVMSYEYEEQYITPNRGELPIPGKPRVGWMTYLRNVRLLRLPEQVPCKTVNVDDLGKIFIVADDHRFSVHNPEDVARAQALTAFLEEHHALEQIPTNLPM